MGRNAVWVALPENRKTMGKRNEPLFNIPFRVKAATLAAMFFSGQLATAAPPLGDFEMNDPDGTQLSAISNAAPNTVNGWGGNISNIVVTNGGLRYTPGGNKGAESALGTAYASGKQTLAVSFSGAELSGGGKLYYVIKDASANVELFSLLLQKGSDGIQLRFHGSSDTYYAITGGSNFTLPAALDITVDYDLDSDTADVAWSCGGSSGGDSGLAIQDGTAERLKHYFGNASMATTDFIATDYVRVSLFSEENIREDWQFNDAAGTAFEDALNSEGTARWDTDKFSTDGAGSLVIDHAGGDRWHCKAVLPESLPVGLHETEWRVNALDLSHSSAENNCGASVAFGEAFNVLLYASGPDKVALISVGSAGRHTIREFDTRTLSNLTIRTVCNTMNGTAVVHSQWGSEAEQASESYSINSGAISTVEGGMLGALMDPVDFVKMDYITLRTIDLDSDGDGILDGDDPDDDNDGHLDGDDAFPFDPTEWADENGNGVGDNVQFDQAVLDEFYTKFGVTLTASEHGALARAVDPSVLEGWRTDAENRIGQYRKANLELRVIDGSGNVVPNAQVHFQLKKKNFIFGAAVPTKNVVGIRTYPGIATERFRELILDFCDGVGANNAFKPKLRRGLEGTLPDFMTWAETNNLPVRGHLLMWPSGNGKHLPYDTPTYTPNYAVSNLWRTAEANPTSANIDALRDEVDYQISDWASKYEVTQWDVINENTDANVLTNLLGEHCVVDWFNNAASNRVNSSTELFINDYNMIAGDRVSKPWLQRKVDRCKQLIEYLQTNNAPLDGLGLQSHFGTFHVEPETIYSRLNEFSSYGLNLAGTEFNFDVGLTEREYANRTAEVMTEYFSHPSVSQLLMWSFVGDGEKYFIDETSGKPFLHGLAWYYLNRIKWTTDETRTTSDAGSCSIRGFKGEYQATITCYGAEYQANVTLISNDVVTVQVDLPAPGSIYSDWAAQYPALGNATNELDNPDGDLLSNLAEYALGGDPSDGNDHGYAVHQSVVESGGSCYVEYIYARRSSYGNRGLDYALELGTDLLSGSWTNSGYGIEGVGTDAFGDGYDAVTNRIPVDGVNQKFIRLKIILN